MPQAVKRAFKRERFDAVIHFAAVAYVGESVEQPIMYYSNITVNTIHVLEAMKVVSALPALHISLS